MVIVVKPTTTVTRPSYQGIRFPDRAEELGRFDGYRVFLDHWDALSRELKIFYETIANRGVSRGLAVYGPQGTGKTLFADQLRQDLRGNKAKATT